MEDLWVELYRVGLLALDMEGGIGHIRGGCDDFSALGQLRNSVSVGHPDLRVGFHVLKQGAVSVHDVQHCPSIFPCKGTFHVTSAGIGEVLGSIADTKERKLALNAAQIRLGRIGVPHRAGTAGEDYSFHVWAKLRSFIEVVNFAIDIQFSEPAANELGDLRAEIEDNDFFCHCRWMC